jgi:hypothetical protein
MAREQISLELEDLLVVFDYENSHHGCQLNRANRQPKRSKCSQHKRSPRDAAANAGRPWRRALFDDASRLDASPFPIEMMIARIRGTSVRDAATTKGRDALARNFNVQTSSLAACVAGRLRRRTIFLDVPQVSTQRG